MKVKSFGENNAQPFDFSYTITTLRESRCELAGSALCFFILFFPFLGLGWALSFLSFQ